MQKLNPAQIVDIDLIEATKPIKELLKSGDVNALADNLGYSIAIAWAAGATNTATITVTVTDADGAALTYPVALDVWISEAATGIGLTADSYSGDVTTTTGAELMEHVSKKLFTCLTSDAGVLVLSAVASAKPADQYLAVKHPLTGKLIVSAASGLNWG